jgi:hypothetical protein
MLREIEYVARVRGVDDWTKIQGNSIRTHMTSHQVLDEIGKFPEPKRVEFYYADSPVLAWNAFNSICTLISRFLRKKASYADLRKGFWAALGVTEEGGEE